MARIASSLIVILALVLAFFGGRAISAQDKYTVQVPDGLAFSEFTKTGQSSRSARTAARSL
jgi:hypothetical protein